jgi:serine/threonine protein kinase
VSIYIIFIYYYLSVILIYLTTYRDLKPENLLYQTENEDSLLKLADFGLAEITRPNEVLYSACGSPGYVAPEILDAKSNKTGIFPI